MNRGIRSTFLRDPWWARALRRVLGWVDIKYDYRKPFDVEEVAREVAESKARGETYDWMGQASGRDP